MRLALLFAVLAAPAAVFAQAEWRPVPAGPALTVDVLHGLGDDFQSEFYTDEGASLGMATVGVTSTAVVVGARVPVGRWGIVGDLPLSFAGQSVPSVDGFPGGSARDVTVGNPYLGVEAGVGGGLTIGGGARLPLVRYKEDGFVADGRFGWVGGLTADPERFDAYLPGVLAVSAEARQAASVGPVGLRLRLAPTYLAEVSGVGLFGDPDRGGLALGYSALAEGALGRATVSGGVFGRPVLSGEWFSQFGTGATAVAAVSATVGPVRPGLAVRVPLDRIDQFFRPNTTVGLSLDVLFR